MAKIEFYGTMRLRAGVSEMHVDAQTLGDAMAEAERRLESLRGMLTAPERLGKSHSLSLNGQRIVDDLSTPLAQGDAILVIAADPGG